MARYEFIEGSSKKFWEIERKGKTVTTTWGRIGTSGQSNTLQFASESLAAQDIDKRTREKTSKGYRAAGGPAQRGTAAAAKAAPGKTTAAPRKPGAPAATKVPEAAFTIVELWALGQLVRKEPQEALGFVERVPPVVRADAPLRAARGRVLAVRRGVRAEHQG